MARTVDEIKKDMERRWMESAALKTLYGWELGSDNKPPEFAAFYSKASLENVCPKIYHLTNFHSGLIFPLYYTISHFHVFSPKQILQYIVHQQDLYISQIH